MRVVAVIGLALMILALVSCASTPEDQTLLPPSNLDSTEQVIIKGFAFNPQETTIKVGDKVTWVNQDSAHHTITGNGWDSGDLGQNEVYSKSFDNPGTYDYTCTYHPYMKGKVIVE